MFNEDFRHFDITPHVKKYDLVSSWGFIEHFELEESYEFIQKHKEMVSSNGYLIIELPNIRWFNWLLYRLINNNLLKIHNLETMDISFLKRAIEKDQKFKILYGNYYLTSFFEFSSSNEFFKRHSVIKHIFELIKKSIRALHVNDIPNKFFSPYIVFIAKRVKE